MYGTIAEESYSHPIFAEVVRCKRGTHCDRESTSDDSHGADHAEILISDVHGASFAAAYSGDATK